MVGHLHEQRVALLGREVAVAHHLVEQDLDVHLVVGGVDTRGVVDGVGVDAHPVARGLDAAELGAPEVAALPHHTHAERSPVDADRVVPLVAHLGVGLARRLHVGADAAVPEQVDGRGEDGAHELVGGELVG